MSNGPRPAAGRRDWGLDDSQTNILHLDMDAFFASVEVSLNPQLRGLPVIVGGRERGVVLSATYEARAFGVKSGAPVSQARRLCPQGIVVQPHFEHYRRVSRGVMDIINEVTALVEQVSVDEAYLDVRSARRRIGSPTKIAQMLRERVESEFGITCSVGVGSSKLVAKLASTQSKPDGLCVIPRSSELAFLQALPVRAIPGVGAKASQLLAQRGISTVAHIAQTDPGALRHWMGSHGAQLYDLAWGRDRRPVVAVHSERSIGAENTFPSDVRDANVLDTRLAELVDKCAYRARSRSIVGRTVSVKVKTSEFKIFNRSRTLPAATDSSFEILAVARELLAAIDVKGVAIRLVGVRLEGIQAREGTAVQLSLEQSISEEIGALRAAEEVMDQVRQKFGVGVLGSATTMPGAQTAS